jgi:phosphatidylethanolamine/phosphatidyl-N-methylethanolamine N-methyltransferase
VLIFDKFAPKDKGLSPLKKAIRPIIKLLGTDIGINFEELCERNRNTVYVKEDTSLMFSGMYRKIVLGKINV